MKGIVCDVALLPVSGTSVMTAEEATRACELIAARRRADALGSTPRHRGRRAAVRGAVRHGGDSTHPRTGVNAGEGVARQVAIEDDAVMLPCGRTLDQVQAR
jgi:L-ascorbate metabolism protein UlaG (beta-lactamase superfamily)